MSIPKVALTSVVPQKKQKLIKDVKPGIQLVRKQYCFDLQCIHPVLYCSKQYSTTTLLCRINAVCT